MFMVVIGTFAWNSLKLLFYVPRSDALVIILVTIITVFEDLAVAVVAGVIVNALVYAWKSASRIRAIERQSRTEEGAKVYEIEGPLFFSSTNSFLEIFNPEEDPDLVIIDFANSKVDVFVTDGFTGNIVLKTLQGVAKLQMNLIAESLKKNLFKPLLKPVKNALSPVKKLLNPNSTNGSYLLGVNGLVIIGHGSSNAEAIKNALIFTNKAIEKKFISNFSDVSNELWAIKI